MANTRMCLDMASNPIPISAVWQSTDYPPGPLRATALRPNADHRMLGAPLLRPESCPVLFSECLPAAPFVDYFYVGHVAAGVSRSQPNPITRHVGSDHFLLNHTGGSQAEESAASSSSTMVKDAVAVALAITDVSILTNVCERVFRASATRTHWRRARVERD